MVIIKYLFFDLECSNCFNKDGKICEFGAILTDEKFNILDEILIPMSPGNGKGCRFDKGVFKRDPDFKWFYDENYYFNCPQFHKFYDKIKKLLTDKDTWVFGYSIDNDIRYLYSTCKRYFLEPIKYDCYDVMTVRRAYMKIKKNGETRGLRGDFLAICDYKDCLSITPHLSSDDAKMTMLLLKAICKNMEFDVNDILYICDDSKYNSEEYINYYLAKEEDKKLHPKEKREKKPKDERQIIWGDFYREYEDRKKDPYSIGRIITISKMIKESKGMLLDVIDKIKSRNLIASDKIYDSNYVIVLDEKDGERLKQSFKYPFYGKMINVADFLDSNIELG